MGSFSSTLSNEADSDQYHLYFYTTEREMIDWFELLHGSPAKKESEVKSTQTDTIGVENGEKPKEAAEVVPTVQTDASKVKNVEKPPSDAIEVKQVEKPKEIAEVAQTIQKDAIEVNNIEKQKPTSPVVQMVQKVPIKVKKPVMIDQPTQSTYVEQTLPSKPRRNGFFAKWIERRRRR